MKHAQAIYEDCKKRGYLEKNNVLYHPDSHQGKQIVADGLNSKPKKQKRLKGLKTGWIDDYRNVKCLERFDVFTRLIKQELDLTLWPEFYFSTDRLYRLDYAIPTDKDGKVLKIGIEIDGGIWCKGKSGHSSGKGIKRDQQKSSLLASNGWRLLRFEPSELLTIRTIELIKKTVFTSF